MDSTRYSRRLLALAGGFAVLAGQAQASSVRPPFYPMTVTPVIGSLAHAGGYTAGAFPPFKSQLGGTGYVSQTVGGSTGTGGVAFSPDAFTVAQSSTSGSSTPGYFGADASLIYPVEIDASNAAVASEISALIALGPIGSVAANYHTGTSGVAQASVSFGTGNFDGAEGSFSAGGGANSSYYLDCGFGYYACTSGTFNAPISFKSASALAQTGSPLVFLSGIAISAQALTGYSCIADGILFTSSCNDPIRGSGNAIAYIDPKITLNLPGIDPNSYTLIVGNGQVANALGNGIPGVGGVPEAASWAMLIAGFATLGVAARRRRTVALSA